MEKFCFKKFQIWLFLQLLLKIFFDSTSLSPSRSKIEIFGCSGLRIWFTLFFKGFLRSHKHQPQFKMLHNQWIIEMPSNGIPLEDFMGGLELFWGLSPLVFSHGIQQTCNISSFSFFPSHCGFFGEFSPPQIFSDVVKIFFFFFFALGRY